MSSVDNTFYMLSKTNNEDPNQSREISNVGKSFKGQYDKMVEDFEDLIEKRKVDGQNSGMTQSQMDQRIPVNQGKMSRSQFTQRNPQNQGMNVMSQSQFAQRNPQNQGMMSYNHNGLPSQRESQYAREVEENYRQNSMRGPGTHDEEVEAYNRIIQEQLNQQNNSGQRVNHNDQNEGNVKMETNYNNDLNEYFDTEINQILDKIKRCKVEGVNDCDVHLGGKYKLMNCTNSLKKGELEHMEMQRNINTGGREEHRPTMHHEKEVEQRRYTEKANEMFENKDIEELKNRVKAVTMVEGEEPQGGRSKTFHNKLQEDAYLKNLVKPEINRAGEFEGEIEVLKRKTIIETTTPHQSIEGELLSRGNEGENTRRSQQSNNFSFNPKTAKQNMNNQMNDMINEMDLQPVKKNITVSMVIDGLENRNLEDLKNLRDKANTMHHGSKKRRRRK